MPYGQDIWLTPVVLTSSNNKFRIFEDTGSAELIATVAAGTYWLHDDAATDANFPSLYLAISAAIAALSGPTATNTYTWQAVTPTDSSSMTNAGLKLIGSDATVSSFTVDFDDADFTMDPAWFGFRVGYGNLVSGAISSDPSASDEVIVSDFTVKGRWYSHCRNSANAASSKTSFQQNDTVFSTKDIGQAAAVRWRRDRVRTISYEDVKSPHVFPTRADDSDTAWMTGSDLGANDANNAFEDVWIELADLGQVIIVHNDAQTVDLDVETTATDWEVVQMNDARQAMSFSSVARLSDSRGEFYNLSVDLWVDPDYDNYTH